jgi:hypothetical protein
MVERALAREWIPAAEPELREARLRLADGLRNQLLQGPQTAKGQVAWAYPFDIDTAHSNNWAAQSAAILFKSNQTKSFEIRTPGGTNFASR